MAVEGSAKREETKKGKGEVEVGKEESEKERRRAGDCRNKARGVGRGDGIEEGGEERRTRGGAGGHGRERRV